MTHTTDNTDNPSDGIRWQEPPPSRRKGRDNGELRRFVEALKTRPGEWAIYEYHNQRPKSASFKRYTGVEATTRKEDDGTTTTYARWIGES